MCDTNLTLIDSVLYTEDIWFKVTQRLWACRRCYAKHKSPECFRNFQVIYSEMLIKDKIIIQI